MQVQLTYATHSGGKYSFYISFPEDCALDVDDCSVDVSQKNIVLLLRKDLPESTTDVFPLWDKFSVGLNAGQTKVCMSIELSGWWIVFFSIAGEVVSDFLQCRECDRESRRFTGSMG